MLYTVRETITAIFQKGLIFYYTFSTIIHNVYLVLHIEHIYNTIEITTIHMQTKLMILSDSNIIHRESKKGCHPNHGYNFVNS